MTQTRTSRLFQARFLEMCAQAAADGTLPIVPCSKCGSSRSEPIARRAQRHDTIAVTFECPRCRANLPPEPVPPLIDRVTALELTVDRQDHVIADLQMVVADLRLILAGVRSERDLTYVGRHPAIKQSPR